jgi:hypothetical protein
LPTVAVDRSNADRRGLEVGRAQIDAADVEAELEVVPDARLVGHAGFPVRQRQELVVQDQHVVRADVGRVGLHDQRWLPCAVEDLGRRQRDSGDPHRSSWW